MDRLSRVCVCVSVCLLALLLFRAKESRQAHVLIDVSACADVCI